MTSNPSSTELRSICPFCGSITQSGRVDGKFYINLETGLYYCFHCQVKGKGLTDEQLESLIVIDEIVKKSFDTSKLGSLSDKSLELDSFLAERLASTASLKDKVLYSEEQKAIAIPTVAFNGEIVGIKYRKLDPEASPRYLSEPGSVNEGYWLKGEDDSKLLIVEGEIDALSAVAAGFKGTVLATQTNRLAATACPFVKGFKNVFVIPDKDLGGEELKNSIESLLGPFKSIVVIDLPEDCKDLNDLLRRSYEECCELIRVETRTELERDTTGIADSLRDMLTWLSDERNTSGDKTGWESVDYLLGGGLRAREMSVINAFAKVGKSSFINNLVYNLAKSGKKIALASFEMDPARAIYPSILSIAYEQNIREMKQSDLIDVTTHCLIDFPHLANIVSLRRFGYTPWSEIEEWAKLMKSQHNIDYLVLDHAGFMVEKMTDAEENQILAKNIKRLTNELSIHIPVVVQAPKTKDGLSIQTAYGGLAWAMNADNFFILERSKDNENELRVKLEAARYPGANPSSTPALLFYDRNTCKLTE